MKNYWIGLVFILFACNSQVDQVKDKSVVTNPLKGNWQFLDKYGNYNEAFFDDSLYQTMNRFVNRDVTFNYIAKNDSLYSDLDKRKNGMSAIAALQWLDDNHVIISTEFVRDTLSRMPEGPNNMADIRPYKDSALFFNAFYKRYEIFLIQKGIITQDEVAKFREEGKVPEDIKVDKGSD